MRVLTFLLGAAAATLIHALGVYATADFPAAVDLFLVLAVMNGLGTTVGWSTLGGSAAGLARDALSGGPYGLHGFADTLVAHLTARLQQRLVIQQPLQIGVLLALAAILQLAVLGALQALLLPSWELPSLRTMTVRVVLCGALGTLLSLLGTESRLRMRRWRERRRRRLRMASR